MKYTAKDVSKIMNINRETLRYYEKLDLLSPEIDEKNGYRYYDDWDLNYIGECKHFRSLGFNIQEIKEIFQNDNLRDFTEKMEEKQQTYLNQLKFYEMLVKKNASDIEKLKNISTSLSFCQITETNQRYFVPNRKNFDFSCSFEKQSVLNEMMDFYPFIDATIYITRNEYEDKKETFSWGFSITAELAKAFSISTDSMTSLPAHKAIHCVVDAGERGNLNYTLFAPITAYMEEKNLQISGDIYGNLLARVNEEDGLHRYIEIYFPISS